MEIKAQEKNKRVCTCCFALYVINGDESELWFEYGKCSGYPEEGLCEFCNPKNRKWYIINKPCHVNITTTKSS